MREIFSDREVLLEFDQKQQTALLKEELTGQAVVVSGIPLDGILLKLDVDKKGYKLRSSYFNSKMTFIHKGCDYCLIMPSRQAVVFFELKSDRPKGYVDQFFASKIFMDYSFRLSGYMNCCDYDYGYVYVLFCTKNNVLLTSVSKVMQKKIENKCGKEIVVKMPGFPKGINIDKLL
ncbi:MAG: hypothetical protein HGB12_14255 [Bacteroidetes bacterium]|nr:hypothetical protein [Bacteroidota bacterium]